MSSKPNVRNNRGGGKIYYANDTIMFGWKLQYIDMTCVSKADLENYLTEMYGQKIIYYYVNLIK